MSRRPERLEIVGEAGARRTLHAGSESFAVLPGGPATLVLGVGPEPGAVPVPAGVDVAYVDSPEFLNQMGAERRLRIPSSWRRLPPGELTPDLVRSARVFFYRPNLGLFPSFWGPIWGLVQAWRLGLASAAPERSAIVPAAQDGLIVRELSEALSGMGYQVRTVDPTAVSQTLPRLLAEVRPELFFSVNLQGFDPEGEVFHLLEAAGVRAGSWIVDNPFHLLSRIKAPFWRRLHLFVTDDWFVMPLRAHGAQHVHHLPLAAWPGFGDRPPVPDLPELSGRLVFVGRSEFPGRRKFFAGLTPPTALLREAEDMLGRGMRPDFAWWTARLGLSSLWPGREARLAGLGAEEAGRLWRTAILRAAARLPLTVYGDGAWNSLVPGAEVRPGVDYYGPLAAIYRQAAYTLNATSLLLPRGLTQRHFDVWNAGGFLLTDATPGLDIFPAELAREVTFSRPADIPAKVARFERERDLKEELRRAWAELIRKEHTVNRRAETALAAMGMR